MSSTEVARPGYRKPWTFGAYAYPEADTFADLQQSMYRRRKSYMINMPNDGEAGQHPCASCGVALGAPHVVNEHTPSLMHTTVDKFSTWHVDPKSKTAYGQHYYCSWGTLLTQIFALGSHLSF